MKQLDILVADDHNLVREGLMAVVKTRSFTRSVTGVENGKEAIEHVRKYHPDLVLMDLNMPVMDGIDASKHIVSKYPETKVIVLTGFQDDKVVFHTVEIGIHGYLLKDSKPAELEQAIIKVMNNGFYFPDMVVEVMRKGLVKNADKPSLHPRSEITEREKQVLKLICHEKTTKEIADLIHLSDRTVEKIRSNLADKLNVKGTIGLVKFSIENGYDL